ncbi:hypothetical protein JI57_03200 [Psychromonas sp. PRT-SC03]|nr:hypothetical protein JI57_03200 [Psychromonas sp. PRT-SC03]
MICQDANLNATCDTAEIKKAHLYEFPHTMRGPFLIDSTQYFLSAPGQAQIISPFTTLIQNEVLFNPLVQGDYIKAQDYLNSIFEDVYGIDFEELNAQEGPKAETQLLLASFKYALSLKGGSKYLKIATAVDKMVSEETFDITNTLTQNDLNNRLQTINNKYLLPGTYSVTALKSLLSFSINGNTRQLLSLSDAGELFTMNLNDGTYTSFSPASKSKQMQISRDKYKHKHKHDDSDHYKHYNDGWDNWYDAYINYYNNGNSNVSSSSSRLIFATQGAQSDQAYLVYQEPNTTNADFNSECKMSGNNGVFLTATGSKLITSFI